MTAIVDSNVANLPIHGVTLRSEAFDCTHLRVRSLEARETISALYRWDLTLALVLPENTRADVTDPDLLLNAPVTIELASKSGDVLRTVHGIVASATLRADASLDFPTYELVVVPSAWHLGLVKTQEIFMDMSVPEIIADKFERLGLEGYATFRTFGQYDKREFVVQYKETDLAFVSRLAEDVGMSFHFEHDPDGDREALVFSDHHDGFAHLGDEPLELHPHGEKRGIYDLAVKSQMIPAMYAVSDYNWRKPDVDLGAVHELTPEALGLDQPETERTEGGLVGGIVEYGTHHKTPTEGARFAQIRAEESLAGRRIYRGRAVAHALSAGTRLHLDEHPYFGKLELLVTTITHSLEQSLGSDEEGKERVYRNTFDAVSTKHAYRPPRVTPRPRIHGVVTGIVQPGPNGETGGFAELDADGSYTVQFHYDTTEAGEQKASRPVRMAQPFAGPSQGMHFPLRPGTEVLLVFLDGDPDRPLIVGAVPNPVTVSPSISQSRNKNRIRTASGIEVEISDGR